MARKEKVVIFLAKHWPLILGIVSILWIALLVEGYYNQVDTLEDMKEDQQWLEEQGIDAEFMDEYIEDQEERVDDTRVSYSMFILIHSVAAPCFVFIWNKKFRHHEFDADLPD